MKFLFIFIIIIISFYSYYDIYSPSQKLGLKSVCMKILLSNSKVALNHDMEGLCFKKEIGFERCSHIFITK